MRDELHSALIQINLPGSPLKRRTGHIDHAVYDQSLVRKLLTQHRFTILVMQSAYSRSRVASLWVHTIENFIPEA